MRLPLLGERLVAFREPATARVGVMDHRCPHRSASLFFGRNEEGGLRCIYHGWKFDADGRCVDMPNIVDGESLRQAHAGPRRTEPASATASSGCSWAHRDKAPALPRIEVLDADDGDIEIEFAQRECNWLQALEGDIDTSHLGFLHVGNVEPDDLHDEDPMRHVVANRAPALQASDAPWGTTYCATKTAADGKRYCATPTSCSRVWTQAPQGPFETNLFARAWVPMDDTHTMSITLLWKQRGNLFRTMKSGEPLPGVAPLELLPNTTDWLGRFRTRQNMAQRLPDRPRSAAHEPHLLRHREHRRAGPGGHRVDGPDHRPHERAPDAERPDDRAHAAPAAAGGARAGERGHGGRPAPTTRRCTGSRAAARWWSTPTSRGRRPTRRASGRRCGSESEPKMQGRIVAITGAARGIGEAVARAFVARGASLVAMDRRWDSDSAWHAELRAAGALIVSCDITADAELDAACDAALRASAASTC